MPYRTLLSRIHALFSHTRATVHSTGQHLAAAGGRGMQVGREGTGEQNDHKCLWQQQQRTDAAAPPRRENGSRNISHVGHSTQHRTSSCSSRRQRHAGREGRYGRRKDIAVAAAAADRCGSAAEKRGCKQEYLACGHRTAQHSTLQQQEAGA